MTYLKSIRKSHEANRHEETVLLSQEAINKHPGFILYYEFLSTALIKLNRFEDALDCISRGLLIDSSNSTLKALKTASAKYSSKNLNVCGQVERLPITKLPRTLELGNRISNYRSETECTCQDTPLVTVVTAVFNNDKTLERCIQSISLQSYPNIEHIVIDGGSNDKTTDILLKNKDYLEYVVSEPDAGIYDAMNKGISVAKGSFVCLLNSDDTYEHDFISNLVQTSKSCDADVIYSDFKIDGKLTRSVEEFGAGIYFGNLNANHATFLVKKEVYNKVGLYKTSYNIISDIVWIKDALELGIKFKKANCEGFNFYTGGASSGNDSHRKERIFSEIARLYQSTFRFLSPKECISIYTFRFAPKNAETLLTLIQKHGENQSFINCLASYVSDCLTYRDNFKLASAASSSDFVSLVKLTKTLDLDVSLIRIDTAIGCFSEILKQIKKVCHLLLETKNDADAKVILHYAFQFSTPSETFIYDFINRFNDGNKYKSVFLCDKRVLVDERPFENLVQIDWGVLNDNIRNELYVYFFKLLNPDLIVSHFALNDWKLSQRLTNLNLKFPTIAMTHGIDVFTLSEKPEYKSYLLEKFSEKTKHRLTTVSKFLRQKLLWHGIPLNKVDLIHNCPNPNFYENRKIKVDAFTNKTVRILSIGRCIDWKGHDDLIKAVSKLKKTTDYNFSITIVYGGQTKNLNDLNDLREKLDVTKNFNFIEFVDFAQQPEFHHKFDIYVQASKESNDREPRTETFGVAALEAIYSGLPTVLTKVGGLAEFDQIFHPLLQFAEPNNPSDLAAKLLKLIENMSGSCDNSRLAQFLFDKYSSEKQRALFDNTVSKVLAKNLRVALLTSNTTQGAGYAAYRVHKSLRKHSLINSTLLTPEKTHAGAIGVRWIKHPKNKRGDWRFFQQPDNSLPGMTIFTYNEQQLDNHTLYSMVASSDVINLHWTARFLSVENIAFLSWLDKPLVITIRDMYHLSGGCHFFHGCEKWQSNCSNCPQLIDDIGDLSASTLSYKKENYNFSNITIVVLSDHTREIIKQSIFKDCNVVKIPNSIETDIFSIDNTNSVRNTYNIDKKIKVIGYVPSFRSDVKGFKEAVEVLNRLYEDTSYNYETKVLLLGNSETATDLIKFDCIQGGYVSDNSQLAEFYGAMDVLLLPSLEETFSNTTAEAISCGIPVVGFSTGAIPELAIDGVSGYSVPVGDTNELFLKLRQSLITEKASQDTIREFALQRLTMEKQAFAYQELFHQLIHKAKSNLPTSPPVYSKYPYGPINEYIQKKKRHESKGLKYVFFGASVCEQTEKHDTKEITGFINILEEVVRTENLKCEIERVTAGSCTLGDAGLALIDDVLKLKPDVCFLEWCTPISGDCRGADCRAIFDKLVKNKILPVALILPRKDRLQADTTVFQESLKLCEEYGFPFIDLSSKFSKNLLDEILRDVVHTTPFGAKVYAYELLNFIKGFSSKPSLRVSTLAEDKSYCNFEFPWKEAKNRVKELSFDLLVEARDSEQKFLLLLEQRVGPWSRKCRVRITFDNYCTEEVLELADSWSWRERQCIKPLSSWVTVPPNTKIVKVHIESINMRLTGYTEDQKQQAKFNTHGHQIRPKGRLFCITTESQALIKNMSVIK
ncbi:glycosyltransferase [Alteromonas ponticola]|uniref:Glycosyltransferase n=1 Tax=Alteromonas ponticola TaxID=2720613 RepID=A0ABX1R132_9ALTE|nr:glycosyltransferase [Alteromonas ponticola]NMH60179.1 glycosyltransferase [Alteromonas ponticola]